MLIAMEGDVRHKAFHDPKNQGFGDVTYWVVEGDVGPVATFVKAGGANIQARRVGSAAPTCEG